MDSKMVCGLPCAGFEDSINEATSLRRIPVCKRIDVPDGRYRLEVSIKSRCDEQEVLLFANHRRLLWRGSMREGQSICVTAMCMVHAYLPDGADEPLQSKGIELALIGEDVQFESVCVQKNESCAVMLMGDSTVTDQYTLSPYAPGATYCGWGQMLPAFLGEIACVGNFARSGMTVETFRTEGLYELMRSQLRPGDLVLMQFGHNDQKRSHLTADGGYSKAIHTYIEELHTLGARPVLVTPLARNSWWNEQAYCDLLLPFANAVKLAAAQRGIPLIDLHAFMRDLLIRTGRDAAKVLFHIGDYTHTNDFGAYLAASFVVSELSRLSLIQTKACEEWTAHAPYDIPASNQGDEALTPTGLEALFQSYEAIRPNAALVRMEALELVNRTCGLFAHNAEQILPSDVPLNESWTGDVRCALQHRLIPEEMLADGKLHRNRPITKKEFMSILKKGYGMRCCAALLPQGDESVISRVEAARICRQAKI